MRNSVSRSTGRPASTSRSPPLAMCTTSPSRAITREEAGQLALVDVALVVAVDAGQAVRVEAGFGGVDLDVRARAAHASPSFRQLRSGLIRRRRTGGEPGCAHCCWPVAALFVLAVAASAQVRVARASTIGGRARATRRSPARPAAGRATRTARTSRTDALGLDRLLRHRRAREAIPGCHRSKSAEVHIGDGVQVAQPRVLGRAHLLARQRRQVQARHRLLQLRRQQGPGAGAAGVATTHKNIKAVVVLIGANDYGFADIVQTCVTELADVAVVVEELLPATTRTWSRCSRRRTSPRSRTPCATRSSASSRRWCNGGLRRRVQVRDHRPDLLGAAPAVAGFRYGETGFTRQTIGGCGVWNRDANWARDTVVEHARTARSATRSTACRTCRCWTWPRRSPAASCARTPSGCSRRRASRTGESAGAVDKSEWVQQIRTLTTLFPPYQLQEDAHPNYWGQLALRNCFRQAYNGGAPQAGRARAAPGSTARASRTCHWSARACWRRAIADRPISSSPKRSTV